MSVRGSTATRRAGVDARLARAVALVLLAVLAAAWWNGQPDPGAPSPPAPDHAPATGAALPSSVDTGTLLALLDRVQVVAQRPYRDGYDRDCGPGEGCVFGTPWSDDTDAPAGRDGCDTRNDVLAAQLREVRFSSRSPDCDVVGGRLVDPYTGTTMEYGAQIHVDHVFALSAAWDHGAADWSQRRRDAFANDTDLVLVATTRSANLGKGDSTPAEWLPSRREARCGYLARYLEIAAVYRLSISAADAATVRLAARSSPDAARAGAPACSG